MRLQCKPRCVYSEVSPISINGKTYNKSYNCNKWLEREVGSGWNRETIEVEKRMD